MANVGKDRRGDREKQQSIGYAKAVLAGVIVGIPLVLSGIGIHMLWVNFEFRDVWLAVNTNEGKDREHDARFNQFTREVDAQGKRIERLEGYFLSKPVD